jgi:hypothetical protein
MEDDGAAGAVSLPVSLSVAVAREAQAARLTKLIAPPHTVGATPAAVPVPHPQPEPPHCAASCQWSCPREDDDPASETAPPPVRGMVMEIIDSVIDESSGSSGGGEDIGMGGAALHQLAVPPSIEETVADAAARVAADLVTQASHAAALRRGQESGEWHPQIDAFWVDGSTPDAAWVGEPSETGPIRVDEAGGAPRSRVWRA